MLRLEIKRRTPEFSMIKKVCGSLILGIIISLSVTACDHDNQLVGIIPPPDKTCSPKELSMNCDPALIPTISVEDYANLHNSLLDQYVYIYPTPDAAIVTLPANLAHAIYMYEPAPSNKVNGQVDLALATFYDDYPTPESFLNETPSSLYSKLEEKLNLAVKNNQMSPEIAGQSLTVINLMMHLRPYDESLDALVNLADSQGSEYEKNAVGTLLGSSRWWPQHMAPSPTIQPTDKFIPPWLVETLVGMFFDYIGSLYPIPGYGYFSSFLVAIAANTEPADFPHWGTHYKAWVITAGK